MQIDPNAVTGVHAAKKDEIKPPFFKKKHTCKDLICFMKGLYPNPRGLSISEAHPDALTALKKAPGSAVASFVRDTSTVRP